jgi:Cof subfamily protein (haloacid dehalogenase superfamily)
VTDRAIKLLVVDVDGTLIGSSGDVSPVVRQAIAQAQQSGLGVALCSGRPMASVGAIARSLGLAGPHIAFNGALVRDPVVGTVVRRTPLLPAALDHLIVLGREAAVCLELYTDVTHYVERDRTEAQRHAESIRVTYEVASFDRFFGRTDIVKGQIVTGDDRDREVTRHLASDMAGQLRFSVAIPTGVAAGMECVNVVDPSVSKGEAVKALFEYLGLTRDQVAGAGDALNDLPMLEVVGWRFAMGNAEPELKAVSDCVVAGVEEDGLAEVIDRIL